MRSLFTFIAGCWILAATPVFASDLWVSRMEDGDRIEFTEHSVGCFHNRVSYYEIQKKNGTYTFCEYAISWDNSVPPKMTGKTSLGRLVLSAKDVRGLDKLLEYYRSKKSGGSTTSVTLLVEFFEPGGRVGAEQLSDESGGFVLAERKDVLTFSLLKNRLQGQGAGGVAKQVK